MTGKGGKKPQPSGEDRNTPRPASGIVSSGSREAFTPGEDGTGKEMVERKIAIARFNREAAHQAYTQSIREDAVDIVKVQRKILKLAFADEPLTDDERKDLKLAGDTAERMLDRLIGKATQVQAVEGGSDSAIDKARKWAQRPGGTDERGRSEG